MTPEEAKALNEARAQEKRVKEMARKITQVREGYLIDLGEDKLRQIMNLIGIE